MKATIISDEEYLTDQFQRLHQEVESCLKAKDFEVQETQVGRDDLTFCRGCFGCWVKKPGECVINDSISQINRAVMNSDVVVYLSPVVFGQFSANIKNVIDRWLPNMLPFFVTRPDGSTMHPPRYNTYPKQIIIGYANELTADDGQLFIDITRKHRRNVEVLVYHGEEHEISAAFGKMDLKREDGQL
nr:NAD(P)H-dependent oxidoreductase [uncultured Caproiciproducens sp.]